MSPFEVAGHFAPLAHNLLSRVACCARSYGQVAGQITVGTIMAQEMAPASCANASHVRNSSKWPRGAAARQLMISCRRVQIFRACKNLTINFGFRLANRL